MTIGIPGVQIMSVAEWSIPMALHGTFRDMASCTILTTSEYEFGYRIGSDGVQTGLRMYEVYSKSAFVYLSEMIILRISV
jgi:hypothetical protein